MKRSLQGTVAALAVLAAAVPALAADYPMFGPDTDSLRPAYPQAWENPDDDLRFEFGTRYWMSWGEQDAGFTAVLGGTPVGDVGISTRDQSHIGELHGKIEDLSTQTYLSGKGGLSLNTTGTYAITPGASSGAIGRNSNIGYAGADFGWLPLGDMRDGAAIGGFVGYQYWSDAPDIGTGQYATGFDGAGVPTTFGPAKDSFDIHALRLGIKGQATYEMFDLQGEIAAVPYAHVSGTVGGSSPGGFDLAGITIYERAPTTISGRGYGLMAEGMVGFHPTENLVVRVGGRAWYLEGDLETQFHGSSVAGDVDLTLPSNFARIFRYGALFELTGKF